MNMEGVNVSDKKNMKSSGVKEIDVATLLNLCVDIVLKVPELPPGSIEERKTYLEQLSKSPPDKKYWEAGGNCNTTIAATRLGLRCKTIGHVGDEIYGRFLLDVLHDEGVGTVGMSEDNDSNSSYIMPETIVCWVFVDPSQRHDFCSRIDFIMEPALSWMSELSSKVKMAINKSKILVCDGYGFGELTPRLMVSAVKYAVKVGTSVFFDPGPQGKILSNGTPEEQRALGDIMKISDVLLLTSEEAESLTDIGNPVRAGLELLRKGVRTKWVVVKMGHRGSILLAMSSMIIAPSFKVNVVDTVGCGDSFTAAIAFGFIHKLPMLHTLTLANAVGAATAMGCGAGRNVATLNQVTELLKTATLNEDDNFWDEILDESGDVLEIEFLSRKVSLQMVVSELLPILDSKRHTG